jgi:hypothetical protein
MSDRMKESLSKNPINASCLIATKFPKDEDGTCITERLLTNEQTFVAIFKYSSQ